MVYLCTLGLVLISLQSITSVFDQIINIRETSLGAIIGTCGPPCTGKPRCVTITASRHITTFKSPQLVRTFGGRLRYASRYKPRLLFDPISPWTCSAAISGIRSPLSEDRYCDTILKASRQTARFLSNLGRWYLECGWAWRRLRSRHTPSLVFNGIRG